MENKININNFSEEEIIALIADVLSGNSSQEETEALSAWIASDSSHLELYNQLKSYWNANVYENLNADEENEWKKLQGRINKSARKHPVFTWKNLWRATAVAASLLLGVVIGRNYFQKEAEVVKQYACMTGESISVFELPDGSIVHLNKDSKLEYSEDFGKTDRKVYLEGEGYFEVKRMEDCNFIVDLDGADVIVKGTTFDAYNNTNTGIKGAALVSGSIHFQTDSQYLKLTPSREVVFDVESNDLTISPFDPSLVTAWKDHLFRYKSLTIRELIENISEEFGINVVIENDNFGDERFSGTLDIGLPPASVLDLISMQADASWTKRGGIYYIIKE